MSRVLSRWGPLSLRMGAPMTSGSRSCRSGPINTNRTISMRTPGPPPGSPSQDPSTGLETRATSWCTDVQELQERVSRQFRGPRRGIQEGGPGVHIMEMEQFVFMGPDRRSCRSMPLASRSVRLDDRHRQGHHHRGYPNHGPHPRMRRNALTLPIQ